MQLIGIASIGMQQYAPAALALFAIGFLMFIILLLYVFTDMMPKTKNLKINALFIFIWSLLTVAILIFAAFYQAQITIPSHTITTSNSVETVQAIMMTSQPLATNILIGPLIYILSITSAMMSLLVPGYFVIESWRRKRYGVGR